MGFFFHCCSCSTEMRQQIDSKPITFIKLISTGNRKISLIRDIFWWHTSLIRAVCVHHSAFHRHMLYYTENLSIFLFNVSKVSLYQKKQD